MWVMAALRSILLCLWDERFTKPFRDGVLHPNASCASADEQNRQENNSNHDFPRFHGDMHRPNENKMSDGGRDRASLGVEVWKSSQKWSVQRSAVRSIAWLGVSVDLRVKIGCIALT
jgi:hypothetical protein